MSKAATLDNPFDIATQELPPGWIEIHDGRWSDIAAIQGVCIIDTATNNLRYQVQVTIRDMGTTMLPTRHTGRFLCQELCGGDPPTDDDGKPVPESKVGPCPRCAARREAHQFMATVREHMKGTGTAR